MRQYWRRGRSKTRRQGELWMDIRRPARYVFNVLGTGMRTSRRQSATTLASGKMDARCRL